MKKLNNKGYLLVEIIVAIVLALGIGYFLMNLTIKFSREDEDIYQSIYWTNDKNILTNIIMEDIEKYTLTRIKKINDSQVDFTYNTGVTKSLSFNGNKVIYGDFEKNFDESLEIQGIEIGSMNGGSGSNYAYVKIPMKSMYSDEDFGIRIFVPYFVEDVVS